jgi:3-oxoacyl-[acyl-carrier protein] reductase
VKALAPQIKARHRTRIIVVITEACAGRPPAGVSDYVTAKYALMGLARALASELARYNCTVNMISPGMTATSFIAGLPPKLAEMTAEQNPMKRIAQPDDIAGVAAFLASDEADYLNGVNIPVNGGAVMS